MDGTETTETRLPQNGRGRGKAKAKKKLACRYLRIVGHFCLISYDRPLTVPRMSPSPRAYR